ncbi:SH3 domain-containing protein [Marinobacter daqiaonensis]|uniref:SH3 domain-containing protein n=1 Tax=Marinobacter daqiaonensis TaxID=650891 RepID=A0A1I6GJN6_9GAMM|nr:SH3 domain-containing protein [Marinobacter daqiaonensis]SFR42414.1 SH3 domain-containing protein [Marinobacter daqiaonensis]
MKTRLKPIFLLTALLASQPACAASLMPSWSHLVGQVLSQMPILENVGEKILANRIVYIELSDTSAHSRPANARVRLDLGSAANVRETPGTGAGSRIVTQLQPGDSLSVIGRVAGKSWVRIRLPDDRIAYIHQNLIELK